MVTIQEQDQARQDLPLSPQDAVIAAERFMGETMGILKKRLSLKAYPSSGVGSEVVEYKTSYFELAARVTYLLGKDKSRTLSGIAYYDRGSKCFELGLKTEREVNPQNPSGEEVLRGFVCWGNDKPNTVGAKQSITEKLARLKKAYA